MIQFKTSSPEQTYALGKKLAVKIEGGLVLCLEGDLGAGKTLFVKGIAHGLGIEEEVTSPTFSLMNIYEGRYMVYHFDLYRLETADELTDIGFYEYSQRDGDVVIIEWPDKFPEELPEESVWITIACGQAEDDRIFTVRLVGTDNHAFYEELKQFCQF